jgi:hypothetical protein
MKHLLAGAVLVIVGLSTTTANGQCSFPHPKNAGKFQTSLVQPLVTCGNPGGNPATTTGLNTSVPGCQPVQGYYERNGHSHDGWRFDPVTGKGQLQLKASKVPASTATGQCGVPCNPPGDTTDMLVSLTLAGVNNADGPVGPILPGAPGQLDLTFRATLRDRANGDMTLYDYPVLLNFVVHDGKAKVKSSIDTLLNNMGVQGLPHCTALEFPPDPTGTLDQGADSTVLQILDENGDLFAVPGLFMP